MKGFGSFGCFECFGFGGLGVCGSRFRGLGFRGGVGGLGCRVAHVSILIPCETTSRTAFTIRRVLCQRVADGISATSSPEAGQLKGADGPEDRRLLHCKG